MKKRIGQFAFLWLLLVSLSGCVGPRPLVVRETLAPPQSPDHPHTLYVQLRNQGSGEGQVEVIARLRSQGTSQVVAETSEAVDLQPHETLTVTLALQPTAPGPYTIDVETHYPPE